MPTEAKVSAIVNLRHSVKQKKFFSIYIEESIEIGYANSFDELISNIVNLMRSSSSIDVFIDKLKDSYTNKKILFKIKKSIDSIVELVVKGKTFAQYDK